MVNVWLIPSITLKAGRQPRFSVFFVSNTWFKMGDLCTISPVVGTPYTSRQPAVSATSFASWQWLKQIPDQLSCMFPHCCPVQGQKAGLLHNLRHNYSCAFSDDPYNPLSFSRSRPARYSFKLACSF